MTANLSLIKSINDPFDLKSEESKQPNNTYIYSKCIYDFLSISLCFLRYIFDHNNTDADLSLKFTSLKSEVLDP